MERKPALGENRSATITYVAIATDFPGIGNPPAGDDGMGNPTSGIDDELAIRNAINAESPSTFDGLPWSSLTVTRTQTSGATAFVYAEVLYGNSASSPEPSTLPATGSLTSWSTRGRTENVKYALATVNGYTNDLAASADGGAINVDANNRPQGIDIPVPGFTFSVRRRMTNTQMSQAYALQVSALTGHTNAAVFQGFAVEEVRFLGADARQLEQGGDWDVDFSFEVRRTKPAQTIGDFNVQPYAGWLALDVRTREVVDTGSDRLVSQVWAVKIYRVMPTGDFSLLGL
ncbi:MAG: hypothetical protein AAGH64_05635 [Planctomycetota bacterium]